VCVYGGTCSTHGRDEKYVQNFIWKAWREENPVNLGVDGKVIFQWILVKVGWVFVDCMHLAQDRNQWWTVLSRVMNLWVPYTARNLLTNWVTVSYSRRPLLHGISYFSRFRPPRKHTASQLQRSVCLCLEGTSEHGNEPLGSIKGREFLD
jgi:hypothetical protein